MTDTSTTMDVDAPTKIDASCIWFDKKKGYGFLETVGSDKNIFVHQSDLQMEGFRYLRPQQSVRCVVNQDDTGRVKATQVELVAPLQVKRILTREDADQTAPAVPPTTV